MPAAIPIVAPLAGAAIGGIMQGNENSSNQQAANAAQQSAQNATQQAQQQALAQQQAGFQQALTRYQQYQKQNASPIYAQQQIQGPPQLGGGPGAQVGGGTVGGPGQGATGVNGTMGPNQQAPQAEQKIPSQQLSAFIQLLQQAHGNAQKAGQVQAQSAPSGI